MSPTRRFAAGLAAAIAVAVAAPSAHALPRQNVCGPGWIGDYQNDVAYASSFNDQAVYYWNLMDVVQPSDLDYVIGQYNSAISNRDTYQSRADRLLRSCG
jgi:hypothetical protein